MRLDSSVIIQGPSLRIKELIIAKALEFYLLKSILALAVAINHNTDF